MQYAQTIVDQPTSGIDDVFIYKIPPQLLPDIKVGQAVLVPFRNRIISAILTKLIGHIPVRFAGIDLKEIKKIVTETPILDSRMFKLIYWVSYHTGSTLAQAVFSVLPQLPRSFSHHGHVIPTKLTIQKPQKLALVGSLSQRISSYQKLIAHLGSNQQAILIFAEKTLAKEIAENIPGTYLIDSGKKAKERLDDWIDCRSGRHQIIIGTMKTIFMPAPNLAMIIVDDPFHPAYKNQAVPRFRVYDVARARSAIENCHLVFGSDYLPVEIAPYVLNRSYHLKDISQTAQMIFDNDAQAVFNHDYFPEKYLKLIEQSSRILIYHPIKTEYAGIFCQSCRQPIICQLCQNLSYIDQQSNLVCRQCHSVRPIPTECHRCGSTDLKPWRPGLFTIEHFLRTRFPQKSVYVIESKSNLPINFSLPENSIAVATQKVFELINFRSDVTFVTGLWNVFYAPNFRSNEFFVRSAKILANQTKQIIFLTPAVFLDNTRSILAVGWIKKELGERYQHGLPPYRREIQLERQFGTADKAKLTLAEIQKIYPEVTLDSQIIQQEKTILLKANLLGQPINLRLLPDRQDWNINPDPL